MPVYVHKCESVMSQECRLGVLKGFLGEVQTTAGRACIEVAVAIRVVMIVLSCMLSGE